MDEQDLCLMGVWLTGGFCANAPQCSFVASSNLIRSEAEQVNDSKLGAPVVLEPTAYVSALRQSNDGALIFHGALVVDGVLPNTLVGRTRGGFRLWLLW